MSPCRNGNGDGCVWVLGKGGDLLYNHVGYGSRDYTVRPVVTIDKSTILNNLVNDSASDKQDININDDNLINSNKNNSSVLKKDKVNVPNTFRKISIIMIMLGVALISISLIITFKRKNKD